MSKITHEFKSVRRSAYADTEDTYVIKGAKTQEEAVAYAEALIKKDGREQQKCWADSYWDRVMNLNGEIVVIRRHPFTD